MASATGLCMAGVKQSLSGQTYKIALYNGSDLALTMTDYTTTGEVTGTGYTAGGKEVTPTFVETTETVDSVTYTVLLMNVPDTTWANSTISAKTAVLYLTGSGKVLQMWDLTGGTGTAVTSSASDLTLDFPASGVSTSAFKLRWAA